MKKILYFGLQLPDDRKYNRENAIVLHCPLIAIESFSLSDPKIVAAFTNFDIGYTHILLTSKEGVRLFFNALTRFDLKVGNKIIVAVGKATARSIALNGETAAFVASEESSEGIVKLLESMDLTNTSFFWPCSTLSRKVIPNFFERKRIPFCTIPLYTTVTNETCKEFLLEHLTDADELVFTSPSTVNAFVDLYGAIPRGKQITSIGPVTEMALRDRPRSCL